MYKVLLTNPIHPEALGLLKRHAEVVLAAAPAPGAIFDASAGCDGIIVRAQLPDGLFVRRPSLRVAVRHGTGIDFIPIDEATAQGVVVANVPGVNAGSVAEHATMLMLSLARRSCRVVELLKQGNWESARDLASSASEVHGCTIGVIGLGNIGQRIAAVWGGGFGARVLAYAPVPIDPTSGVQSCSMDELLRTSDFVVLACPLTDATRRMVNAAFLAKMKRRAFLINVARGPIVDQAALLAALREGTIAGAGLDVYETHPLDAGSPLLALPNVIATPHCAGISEPSFRAIGLGAVDALLQGLQGQWPANVVNPQVKGHTRKGTTPWGNGLQPY